MTIHPDYWNRLYEEEERPGWDMDSATPLVKELLDLAHPLGLRSGGDLVVPGQGAMHRYGDRVAWSHADWFTTRLGPWEAIFDHTCFVAMDPARRPDYVQACADHLRAGGLWMAVLFHDVKGRPGPPHAVPVPEMRRLAETCFEVLHLGEAVNSHPRRSGREYLLVARKLA